MLSEQEYTALYEAMADRGEDLVVDPESFAAATYAPSYLPLLGGHTAPARWTEAESIEDAWEVARELGAPPWIVKDHAKSAKESWHRACFVPEEKRARCDVETAGAGLDPAETRIRLTNMRLHRCSVPWCRGHMFEFEQCIVKNPCNVPNCGGHITRDGHCWGGYRCHSLRCRGHSFHADTLLRPCL